jgi:hypothetical protein
MYEMSNGPVNFEADRLSCLKFTNPLSFDNHNNIALSSNIDRDYNFFSDIFNCDYYIENSLNEMLAKKASYSDCIVSFFCCFFVFFVFFFT